MNLRNTFLRMVATLPLLVPHSSAAGEMVNLMFGAQEGEHVTVNFSPEKSSAKAIVIETFLVGVAGSRLALSIDRDKSSLIDHIFTNTECKFSDQGSACMFTIVGGNSTYDAIIFAFKKAKTLHIALESAGSMEMVTDVTLNGFASSYDKL